MASEQLEQQIEKEKRELASAPVVARGPLVSRCHFCGALVAETRCVEIVGDVERHKGISCCGG